MRKIKVKIDPPPVPKELIHKYKNYDSFMKRYKKYYGTSGISNLLYRDRKKMALILLVAIMFLLWLLNEI